MSISLFNKGLSCEWNLVIKVLSANGYFQLKGYNDSLDVILTEEIYLNGAETIQKKEYSAIYKASFYLL